MDNRYLAAGGVGVLVVAVLAAAFFVLMPRQAKTESAPAGNAAYTNALAPQPGDIGLGDPNAPIKFIEYASAGCGHCAAFHLQVLPQVKKAYIDTGLVYYVLRDFPLESLSAGASLIARCLPREQFYPFMDVLFGNQASWHGPNVANPKEALITLARRAGLSREQVESCLNDKAALERIITVQKEADTVLGVDSTPTLYINGEKTSGALPFDALEAKFKALLPAPPAGQPAP